MSCDTTSYNGMLLMLLMINSAKIGKFSDLKTADFGVEAHRFRAIDGRHR